MQHLKRFKWLLIYFMVSNFFQNINSDEYGYATSVIRTTELLPIEELLVVETSNHIAKLKEKLEYMKSISKVFAKGRMNAKEYLSNPLKAFTLLKRMYADWSNLIEPITKPIKSGIFSILGNGRAYLPTPTDFIEAVDGLQRIQFYYQMNPTYLAEGLFHKEGDGILSCLDLYQISNELLKKKMPHDAVLWFEVALKKCAQRDQNEIYINQKIHHLYNWDIYLGYAMALHQQNDPKKALNIIKTANQKYPFNKQIWYLKSEIEEMLNSGNNFYPLEPAIDSKYESVFLESCRSDTIKSYKNLYCRLKFKKSSFYTLAPLKIEVLNLSPYAAFYHDIITDEEIEFIKSESEPNLVRAKIFAKGPESDDDTDAAYAPANVSNMRTAQNVWLQQSYTEEFYERVAEAMGFDKSGFELFSIINYGIGGHYSAHYDVYRFSQAKNDDRIATALIYLSDVEAGGSTAFPELNLQVTPRKGSLLLWYNFQNDGSVDMKSLHGACPMILGSKWVGTIWIHSKEQVFHKPCQRI